MGRWPDGTSLSCSPTGPNSAVWSDRLSVNFFEYFGNESGARLIEQGVARTVPGTANDLPGPRCPDFTHIRKVNPRTRGSDQARVPGSARLNLSGLDDPPKLHRRGFSAPLRELAKRLDTLAQPAKHETGAIRHPSTGGRNGNGSRPRASRVASTTEAGSLRDTQPGARTPRGPPCGRTTFVVRPTRSGLRSRFHFGQSEAPAVSTHRS